MKTNRRLIQKIIITSNTSSITFSNIPQTYKDLKLIHSSKTSRSISHDEFRLQFNDSSAGYNDSVMYSDASGSPGSNFSSSVVGSYGLITNGNGSVSNSFGFGEAYICDYSSSNNKIISFFSCHEDNKTTPVYLYMGCGLWSNTNPITSINLIVNSGSQVLSNSEFSLYGIDY